MNITPYDVSLVKQHYQRHSIMIQVLNRSFERQYILEGSLISFSSNIDKTSNIRRTCSFNFQLNKSSIDKIVDFNLSNYLKIYRGIQDSRTQQVVWYSQGVYIINNNSFTYNVSSQTLSMSCSDLVYDLTGDRKGKIEAFSPLLKHSERIQDVIIGVLENHAGITNHDVAPICPYFGSDSFWKDSETLEMDYCVPYDISFSTGVSVYEVIEKMVTLYPQWVMYFDEDGKFIVKKDLLEQDDSSPLLDNNMLTDIVLSESLNFDYKDVKNSVVIYGKDGLFYGKAQDNNTNSPFNVNAYGEILEVLSGGNYDNIQTIYYDDNMTLVAQDGNEQAQEWAEYELYNYCRLKDTITLTLMGCPFITDVGFKISYKSRIDGQNRVYMVKAVSHNYNVNSSETVLELVRFYAENTKSYLPQLSQPIITEYSSNGLSVSISVNPVLFAAQYTLYANYKKIITSTSNILTYTFDDINAGTYSFTVTASADGYQDSIYSNGVEFEITSYSNALITDDESILITDDGYYLAYTD